MKKAFKKIVYSKQFTVWNSFPRTIRRHAITILIRQGGDRSPALVPPKINFNRKAGRHCSCDGFYMHQMPLAYMAVFRQASLESGPPGLELSPRLPPPNFKGRKRLNRNSLHCSGPIAPRETDLKNSNSFFGEKIAD